MHDYIIMSLPASTSGSCGDHHYASHPNLALNCAIARVLHANQNAHQHRQDRLDMVRPSPATLHQTLLSLHIITLVRNNS